MGDSGQWNGQLMGHRGPSQSTEPSSNATSSRQLSPFLSHPDQEKGSLSVTLTIAFLSTISVFLSFPLDLKAYRAGPESLRSFLSPQTVAWGLAHTAH